jgi:hypothetical protein
MEAIMKEDSLEGIKNYFLKSAKPFVSRREVNWRKIQIVICVSIIFLVIGILFWPQEKPEQQTFYEKADSGSLTQAKQIGDDPTQVTISQLKESQGTAGQVHQSLDYLYRPTSQGHGGNSGSSGRDRNSAMILSRDGVDSRTQLSPGTRVRIKLDGKTTLSESATPVMGFVSQDISTDYASVAIPRGSKVMGDASFDSENEKATITWRSIILADGRERPFSGVTQNLGGRVHSDGMKNAMGQTLTRFVGAYASGSMNTGMFGANHGGHANGLRNAIGQTATDRANAMGEDLQKERKWIEIDSGTEAEAIISQSFNFRDAGAMYGK